MEDVRGGIVRRTPRKPAQSAAPAFLATET